MLAIRFCKIICPKPPNNVPPWDHVISKSTKNDQLWAYNIDVASFDSYYAASTFDEGPLLVGNCERAEIQAHINGSAISRLGDVSGLRYSQVKSRLLEAGFGFHSKSSGGYIRWIHQDGSNIYVRPNGEVVRRAPRLRPSSFSENQGMFAPAVDQNGRFIDRDESHNTGEFIEFDED